MAYLLLSHRGTHHGQSDFTLTLHKGEACVGHLDYSVYGGVPAIQYLAVEHPHRRKGYGTRLVCALQADFPRQEIEWGSLTADGAALRNALSLVVVVDPAVAAERSRLTALRSRRDALLDIAKRFHEKASVSQSQRDEYHQQTAPLNDLHDAIDELEQQLAGRALSKRLISLKGHGVNHMKDEDQQKANAAMVKSESTHLVDKDGDLVLVASDGTRFDQSDMERMKSPTSLPVDDTAEFYRWYENGGKARERPLDARELASYLVKERGYAPAEANDAVQFDSHSREDDQAVWNAIAEYRHGLASKTTAEGENGLFFEAVSWQGQGYFGKVHMPNRRDVATVPRPNLRCPEDLYKTPGQALDACRQRAESMLYRATEGEATSPVTRCRLIVARSENEAMVQARKIVDSSDALGHWISLSLPETEGTFHAHREAPGRVFCQVVFADSARVVPKTEYLRKLLSPSSANDQAEVQGLIDAFDTKTKVIGGVVRWSANDQVPPQAVLDLWVFSGKAFDVELSTKTRDKETSRFLADYRAINAGRKPSSEEFSEMRAAFGPDTRVGNVVTGDDYELRSENVRPAPRRKF